MTGETSEKNSLEMHHDFGADFVEPATHFSFAAGFTGSEASCTALTDSADTTCVWATGTCAVSEGGGTCAYTAKIDVVGAVADTTCPEPPAAETKTAGAAAAAADPSLQKYFPQQTGVQLPGAELATQMTQRASSPATTQPAAGEPIGPHSGVKWTAQETQQVAAVAAAAAAAAESQQAQAQEAAATMGLGAQQALAPTQQGHEQGQQQAVAEYQSQQAAPSQQQEAPSQQQEAPSQQSEQSHESEQDRAQRLARQIVTGDLQGQQGQQALLRNDMPRVSELPFERTEGHSRKWMELSQRNSMLADAARRAAESEHSRVLHEEQMRIDEAERLAVLAEAEATRLVRARLLQADQMKTRIQAEARSRMETAKIALKSAQDNSLIRSEEADRAKAAVETADEEARARVRAEEAARREKAEIDRIAVGASPPSNATAAATTGVSADALAMAALAANTASEPDVSAAKVEQEKTSEEMQAELESLNADPLMQEAEARRREFLQARGAVALPTLENVTIPADGAAALETKPAPFDPNLASLLMSPQMSSKATNLMATETERPLPAASSIAKALRSDLAFRKEVPMKLL